ncbi:hypothetical protein M404DRAFT_506221 [Pisolithus tinctorius Marx 270]|uniref:Uncharacterized protein n=1 Tax=Pisolithus tinctorius Marx 270 TaxID=870435 RepID=A0A0C3NYI3_PISTI|nr:hypothetical protein M404DRAFT_506221 [Pisolithus tinctorius Marx 270]
MRRYIETCIMARCPSCRASQVNKGFWKATLSTRKVASSTSHEALPLHLGEHCTLEVGKETLTSPDRTITSHAELSPSQMLNIPILVVNPPTLSTSHLGSRFGPASSGCHNIAIPKRPTTRVPHGLY